MHYHVTVLFSWLLDFYKNDLFNFRVSSWFLDVSLLLFLCPLAENGFQTAAPDSLDFLQLCIVLVNLLLIALQWNVPCCPHHWVNDPFTGITLIVQWTWKYMRMLEKSARKNACLINWLVWLHTQQADKQTTKQIYYSIQYMWGLNIFMPCEMMF